MGNQPDAREIVRSCRERAVIEALEVGYRKTEESGRSWIRYGSTLACSGAVEAAAPLIEEVRNADPNYILLATGIGAAWGIGVTAIGFVTNRFRIGPLRDYPYELGALTVAAVSAAAASIPDAYGAVIPYLASGAALLTTGTAAILEGVSKIRHVREKRRQGYPELDTIIRREN